MIRKTLDIMNHPSRWIYRLIVDENLTIFRCVGEYSEVIENEFEGWEIVKNSKILSSIYKYVIQNNLDLDADYIQMLD